MARRTSRTTEAPGHGRIVDVDVSEEMRALHRAARRAVDSIFGEGSFERSVILGLVDMAGVVWLTRRGKRPVIAQVRTLAAHEKPH